MTALYERQRALVRAGLLPKPQRTGRNSGGASANPSTVAVMLISLLATDSLSEVDGRIMDYLILRSYRSNPLRDPERRASHCHLTEATTLFGAVRTILSDPTEAMNLALEVIRETHAARLVDTTGQWPESEFLRSDNTAIPAIERVVRFNELFFLAAELDVATNPRSAWGSNPL